MKKVLKKLWFVCILSILGFDTFGVPVFGYPGQGTPNWNEYGISSCSPGYHWCIADAYAELAPQNNLDLIAFEPEGNSPEEITLTFDYQTMLKKFPKMFKKNLLVLSYTVDLGKEISNELNKQRKVKSKNTLTLKKGQYKIEIKGKQCIVRGVALGNSDQMRKNSKS